LDSAVHRLSREEASVDEGADQIAAYLTWLAVRRQVSASTQNQALSALLFLYRQVLCQDIGTIEHVPRAQTPIRVPVVLSRDEVGVVMKQLSGTEGSAHDAAGERSRTLVRACE
jgi:site-specific recombinase XerD